MSNSLFNKMRARAFTVIELMLAVAILGIIVFALYSVFNQTQRALRRSEAATDVGQRARALSEIIALEIEQAQATRSFYLTNISGSRVSVKEVNMLGGIERDPPQTFVMTSSDPYILPRTNFIHSIFFYNNRTNAWQGIGYRVVFFTNGVGSLQRFETNIFGHRPYLNLGNFNFLATELTTNTTSTNLFRTIADGVVHLTFIPYDHNGNRLGWDTGNHLAAKYGTENYYDTNHYYVTRMRFAPTDAVNTADPAKSDTTDTNLATVILREGIPVPAYPNTPNVQYTTRFQFFSNSLPAYIEMEFGMLEPETLSQYYTMLDDKNPNAAKFLQRQIAKVHLFRQRIPIRTAAQ
jgi:prepilin-type N-terminal cleavage/methylation domain-containing protein